MFSKSHIGKFNSTGLAGKRVQEFYEEVLQWRGPGSKRLPRKEGHNTNVTREGKRAKRRTPKNKPQKQNPTPQQPQPHHPPQKTQRGANSNPTPPPPTNPPTPPPPREDHQQNKHTTPPPHQNPPTPHHSTPPKHPHPEKKQTHKNPLVSENIGRFSSASLDGREIQDRILIKRYEKKGF